MCIDETALHELNKLRKEVSTMSKQNYQLTSDIASLEKKISLLIRNRITPEEIPRYQFCPADQVILERLLRGEGHSPGADPD